MAALIGSNEQAEKEEIYQIYELVFLPMNST